MILTVFQTVEGYFMPRVMLHGIHCIQRAADRVCDDIKDNTIAQFHSVEIKGVS